ncbi:MAG TPA: twin-arginine translocation signal domain-containing protein [Terriglobales bacterium]|nr:twin-arginine translocation signal domain-containing protein [Terriglobales bacterium]
MKKPSDEVLGMNEGITRRDFLNSTLIASGAALLGSAAPSEVFGQPQDDDWAGYGGSATMPIRTGTSLTS